MQLQITQYRVHFVVKAGHRLAEDIVQFFQPLHELRMFLVHLAIKFVQFFQDFTQSGSRTAKELLLPRSEGLVLLDELSFFFCVSHFFLLSFTVHHAMNGRT